ncbi:MAG: glycoside hydrolase family 71/99-like protein [Rubripirellula sp.]
MEFASPGSNHSTFPWFLLFALNVAAACGFPAAAEEDTRKPSSSNVNGSEEPIGTLLGKPVTRTQLEGTTVGSLFLAPLLKAYRESHREETEPTPTELAIATSHFRSRHHERMESEGEPLRKELSEIKSRMDATDLGASEQKELTIRMIGLEARLQPPGSSFASFMLNNWKFQKHLHDNFGGGRVLWQQAGIEAFDAMHRWILEQERQGNFSIADPELRRKLYHYWAKQNHGSFLIEDPDRIDAVFLNPAWLRTDEGESRLQPNENPNADSKPAKSDADNTVESELNLPQQDAHRVDASTLDGKIMCGYQGWFSCKGDGGDLGWIHWGRSRRRPIGPENVTVDLWPDVSELDPDERYATEFRHSDGRVADVFSSANSKTVDRHFRWMHDYGIDGVFLQRFANGLKDDRLRSQKDKVLANVRTSAERHGRVYAVMYDLSGLRSGEVDRILQDWRELTKKNIPDDDTYLHHEGKPVVAIWGIGFSDDRDYSLEECGVVIDGLKSDGCTVMLGVPSWWRQQERDATRSPELHGVLEKADILSPWSVGRYQTPKQASQHASKVWQPDLAWCQERGLDFLPVVYPGFSWKNLHGGELDSIPRLKGQFLWSQLVAAKRIGANMIYVAMFDEVDEGTAIFKCTDDPPVANDVSFLTFEGLPSDHYLRLVGQGGRMLRGEIPVRDTLKMEPSGPSRIPIQNEKTTPAADR